MLRSVRIIDILIGIKKSCLYGQDFLFLKEVKSYFLTIFLVRLPSVELIFTK